MEESYGAGPVTRTGPESCAAVREALTGAGVKVAAPLTHCCHERLLLRVRGADG